MTDDELRALVRATVQKHLAGSTGSTGSMGSTGSAPPLPPPLHPSFVKYALVRPAGDSMCLIEPEVGCNHCGYCQCHGH
jgi:hypothetical protein